MGDDEQDDNRLTSIRMGKLRELEAEVERLTKELDAAKGVIALLKIHAMEIDDD